MSKKKSSKRKSTKNELTIEEQYQKMDQHEHILELPDTYIGSIKKDKYKMWVCKKDSEKLEYKQISYVPGLYKIFDEIIVNARDHSILDKTCRTIKININKENGEISCYNDGKKCIPIVIHKEHKIFVPELIFAVLLTSGNYRQTGKIVGGKNGFGAKLANIYSTEFYIEIVDGKKKYTQRFYNNMYDKDEAEVIKVDKKSKPYVLIKFKPDFKRFGIKGLSDDIISLFKKRIYDIAACTRKNVKVYFNNKLIKINSFEDYIKMYYEELPSKLIYETVNDRWKVGVLYDHKVGFRSISYVNGICTFQGGSHVKHVAEQIIQKLTEYIANKNKKVKMKTSYVKENITVFIDSVIEDPSFNSQLKDFLTNKVASFGSRCNIDEAFIKRIDKETDLVKDVLELAKFKNQRDLKKSDGKKVRKLKGLEKLVDASWAGSRRAGQCYLILTEGDSAKTFAVSGLEIIGRKRFGVFPLKGKLLNAREATVKKLAENEEIKNIKKIMGLKQGVKYTKDNIKTKLRYGGIIILTDQDSVQADTPLLLRKNDKIEIKTIDDISKTDWIIHTNNKECSNTDYEVWNDSGWTKIKKVIRHKVKKKMYRVLTHTGVVDVTEDHSLLDENAQKIKPKNCKVGTVLLHSFPNFEDNRIELPKDLKEINIRDLYKYASKFKIQHYNLKNKDELIKLIKSKSYNEYLKLNKTEIEPDEAYVMGFFWADGSTGTYKCKYTIKSGEIRYRKRHIWGLSNTNLNFLNKSKKIIEKYYDYEFKIYECNSSNANFISRKQLYNLHALGGNKIKPLVEKYRNLFYDKNKNKKIPPEILNASYEVRKNFFEGFYAGDGSKSERNGKVSEFFAVYGKIGAHGLFFLCKSLGYEVSINHDINKPKVYILLLTKRHQMKHPYKIKKIFDLGETEQYVYDLETENHHFQAGIGQLITHNTDGFHIKGLVMNFIHVFWPSLLKIPGFIQSMATPIIKSWKKTDTKKKNQNIFYTLTEYNKWKKKIGNNIKKWKVKYFKGLGTSSEDEAKEAFTDFERRIVKYIWDKDDNDEIDTENTEDTEDIENKTSKCYDAMTLAFDKKRANDRKVWLREYDENEIIEQNISNVSYHDFVHKELKHFSNYDIIRSIPSLCDGLKPSQRKILYGSFLRKIFKDEIKVSQLAGFVSDRAAYHHGEASLLGAIIGMAQDYIGSNNLNLLEPLGAFGNRRQGGKNAASARYIFTKLNDLTPKIFIEDDKNVYRYVDDDGQQVEPITYAPIIPTILVNGTKGIGTGFSTSIPCFNPIDIINNVKRMLLGKKPKYMYPWYSDFKGEIIKLNTHTFRTSGIYRIIDSTTIHITELPIGLWTEDYFKFLDTITADKPKEPRRGQLIEYYESKCGNNTIDIHITFLKNQRNRSMLRELIKTKTLEKRLKLFKSINISNMHLYDTNGNIKKYNTVTEILIEYYQYRLSVYSARKEYLLKLLEHKLQILKWTIKFIKYIIGGQIIIFRKNKARKKAEIINRLIVLKFPKFGTTFNATEDEKKYNYLTNLKIFSLTEEEKDKLQKELDAKQKEYDEYKNTPLEEIWLKELTELEVSYKKWIKYKMEFKKECKKKFAKNKSKTKRRRRRR